MAKYDALGAQLSGGPAVVQLSFAEIDALVGGLPASARTWRQWWENEAGHVQASAWLSAGYKVGDVNLSAETVRFEKEES